MWLFADSGSSKTEWKLVDDDGVVQASVWSEGLNPYFFTEQQIAQIIKEKVVPHVYEVDKVFFYGAGCGLPQKALQVKKAIESAIPARLQAEVAGDILAAARSLQQNQPGICCILGTGANSCVYNGRSIVQSVPSLGYILSDWGSGTVMSKDFLSLMLQEKLPSYIQNDFSSTYSLTKTQILENIYNKPNANRFLASFTPFVLKYADEAMVREVILENFRKFFAYYVLNYEQARADKKVSVVGSVAHHFKKYLLEAAAETGISVVKLAQHPMEGLVQYHCTTAPVNQAAHATRPNLK